MGTRRRFLTSALSGATTAACGLSTLIFSDAFSKAVYTTGTRTQRISVKSVVPRDETIVRHFCHGDVFPLTWTRDDRQFSSFSDGSGLSNAPPKLWYNTRGIWIDGDPLDARFYDIESYPELSRPRDFTKISPYFGFSALAVEDRIYQFLSTHADWNWTGVKLIYSPDQGRTWHNQDGSSPVIWEPYADQSRKTLLFFEEPQRAFAFVSLLQMGRNYEANRDGYVYGYGTNGNTDGLRNQLVMFRVPPSRLPDRSAYEFFAGMTSRGNPAWSKDIQVRAVVLTFPSGWVTMGGTLQSWVPSVVYNAPLGEYLMVSSAFGGESGNSSKSKPSYLGFWSAPHPWGPWTQIYEDTSWTPSSDPRARCYSSQIAPRWIAPDGKSFWLVWSDWQGDCAPEEGDRMLEAVERLTDDQAKGRTRREFYRRCCPNFLFNTQRVDLVLA